MTMIPDVKALGFSLDDERLQHNRTFQRRETQGATVYLYRERERDSERQRQTDRQRDREGGKLKVRQTEPDMTLAVTYTRPYASSS